MNSSVFPPVLTSEAGSPLYKAGILMSTLILVMLETLTAD